ncbi:class I SAM-dependent methyltransferase [Shewanella dokdonensis]|uniref:Class I SAM-dependent methyltransferase n=1 Tax=Shewanella dokdonensis TaxID=712036 RepID=A0ABX8DEM4_9GAMM|nr:class I SAM-dependent methyltransferase [Shewanella dokdonensis]MCL1076108.1 class I SAM-dependent methyltransferase [Shewanella dokdonensis]QVK23169.1 class I SAM-dependent methyltransferase [Shewanella dokdonensis]
MSPDPHGSNWDALPGGQQLRNDLQQSLAYWWPRIFGYHLLQLGPLSAEVDSSQCAVKHQFSVYPAHGATLQGEYWQLPLKSASIDAVAMHLLLESEQDPYRILREVDRVLVSGGYLIISGINPFSSAYLGKLLPKYQQRWPWNGCFFMPARVRDWLGLLGYQLVDDQRLCYHAFMPDWDFPLLMRQWQHRWLPGTGAVYLLVARKLEAPLTPVANRQRKRVRGWQPAATAGYSGRMKRE